MWYSLLTFLKTTTLKIVGYKSMTGISLIFFFGVNLSCQIKGYYCCHGVKSSDRSPCNKSLKILPVQRKVDPFEDWTK